MDIRFLTSIDKNTDYCLLKGTESGSFAWPWLGLRSSLPAGRQGSSNLSSKENKATGMITDNQIKKKEFPDSNVKVRIFITNLSLDFSFSITAI